ncbi:MAG TPA: AlpA family phage regulatory protein [Pseudomonas sp.]|nr:AlpA family phage regulatory protein [Pseudomonas sp.]
MTRSTLAATPRQALVRMPEVQALTGLARPTIYRMIQRDPSFPRPVKLTTSTARNAPVAFVLSEVQGWIEERIQARKTPAPAE